ncbi:hypothetical protein KBC03_06080 [Patescibacteria group bacterium]|nr:hypothetical protein [Patescibacteria group bacterium]
MTNKLPEHNEETTKVVAIPPFEMELDFTQGDPESLLDHIWSTVRDYVVPLIKDKRLHDPRVIAILVNEIAKNVRHHG